MESKKIGLLLGSFDPPHIGHVWAVNYALGTGLSEVWVVPAWKNPWKTNQTPFEKRIDMCKLSFDNESETIKTMDIDGTYQSYFTYEGLEKLLDNTKYLNQTYTIIGGTDIAKQIHKWKNGDWILKNFEVLEVPRWGYKETSLGIACSSSKLRELLGSEKPVYPFLNKETINYIKTNKLYE